MTHWIHRGRLLYCVQFDTERCMKIGHKAMNMLYLTEKIPSWSHRVVVCTEFQPIAGSWHSLLAACWFPEVRGVSERKREGERLTLVMMGGGAYMPPPKVFLFFLLKISPPDQTLRPTCKFLILGLLYHDFSFLLKI